MPLSGCCCMKAAPRVKDFAWSRCQVQLQVSSCTRWLLRCLPHPGSRTVDTTSPCRRPALQGGCEWVFERRRAGDRISFSLLGGRPDQDASPAVWQQLPMCPAGGLEPDAMGPIIAVPEADRAAGVPAAELDRPRARRGSRSNAAPALLALNRTGWDRFPTVTSSQFCF